MTLRSSVSGLVRVTQGVGAFSQFNNAEIGNGSVPALVEKNITRLQVAVDDGAW